MGNFSDSSIEGDAYIQRLATYVRRNEEALANGLLGFSKNRSNSKSLRLNFTIHHLYYITERLDTSGLGVEVGPLNIKLDTPSHEPTFISFMANNARSKHFDSETRSISSINSMKSMVSSASVYLRSSFNFKQDPKVIMRDLRYLYSSFTKIPCLVLTPKTKIGSILSYEEYPCDTSVPIKMFKNLQVLELNSYEPNEIVGWHHLSDQLRILIIRNSKISDLSEVLFNLVIDDESGRSSFNIHKKKNDFMDAFDDHGNSHNTNNFHYDHVIQENNAFKRHIDDGINSSRSTNNEDVFRRSGIEDRRTKDDNDANHPKNTKRSRSNTTGAGSDPIYEPKDYRSLKESNWSVLKQFTVTDTSISSIESYIFKPLGNLVKLNLSSNLLEEIPLGLDQLHNIKYINFADNYIKTLNNLPTNLKNLTTLNFNNNKLVDLKGLQNLVHLEKIDLRRNQLNDLKKLKHMILLYIKCPQFLNVYLAGNKLPKNYRIDLFNMFNGVKYKNSVKIDDSRPGYFELAVLLDSESAFKYLESIFRKLRKSSISKNEASAVLEVVTDAVQDENKDENKDKDIEQIVPLLNGITLENTIPLANNLNFTNKSDSTYTKPSTANKADSSFIKPIASPFTADSFFTKPSIFLDTPPSKSSSVVSSPTSMKRSTTFNAGLDSQTAPNVVTQVVVTARMST